MQDQNQQEITQKNNTMVAERPRVSNIKIHVKTGDLAEGIMTCVLFTTHIFPTSTNLANYTIKVKFAVELEVTGTGWTAHYPSDSNSRTMKYSKIMHYDRPATGTIHVEYSGGTNNNDDYPSHNSGDYYKGPNDCPPN